MFLFSAASRWYRLKPLRTARNWRSLARTSGLEPIPLSPRLTARQVMSPGRARVEQNAVKEEP